MSAAIYSILTFSHKLRQGLREGRECVFSSSPWGFRSYPGSCMLTCKKQLPNQSSTLLSPYNVLLRYDRKDSVQISLQDPDLARVLRGPSWRNWAEPHLWSTLGSPLSLRDWCKLPKTSHHALDISRQGMNGQDGREAAFERKNGTGSDSQVAEILEDYIPSGGGLTERLALNNHPVPPEVSWY